MTKCNKNGFTLIELLVVISIIGVLSGIILQSINSTRLKSDDARRISDLKEIASAINMYFNDNGTYPASINGSSNTCTGDWPASFKAALVPKYIPVLPLDPKNNLRNCNPPYNYYYGFFNTIPATWGANCEINTKVVLYNVGRPSGKVYQDACGLGSDSRINTIIFTQ